MPPEDPAAGTHGQVLPLLLHEGLKGKVDHEGHQGLLQDHLGGEQDLPLDGDESQARMPNYCRFDLRITIFTDLFAFSTN